MGQAVQSVRLFVALELSDSVRQALERPIQILRDAVPPRLVRWTPAENIHLTLKFLGDVPPTQIKTIVAELQHAVQGCSPLTMQVQDAGCFPNIKRPRIVWLGLKDEGNHLRALRDGVEKYIAPLGYPTESPDFTPHLTVGRVKKEIAPADLGKIGTAIQQLTLGHLATWECASVSLMQSDLRPEGAHYTCLEKITLA